MPALVAYTERESHDPETGEPGIFRKEWRVRRVKDFTQGELENQFGPRWRETRPFAEYVLEERYIKYGKEEPWTPHDAANTRKEALEYVDSNAVAVDPTLKRIQEARTEYRQQQEAEIEQKRLVEIDIEERRRKKELSTDAFNRMMAGKNKIWGERWNAFIEAHRGDQAFLDSAKENEGFMRAYDAIFEAVTVPAKVKAIKTFLQAFGKVA